MPFRSRIIPITCSLEMYHLARERYRFRQLIRVVVSDLDYQEIRNKVVKSTKPDMQYDIHSIVVAMKPPI